MRPFLAAIASLLVAVGCGSQENAGERLTKAEYQDAIRNVLQTSQPADRLFSELVGGDLSQDGCASKLREFHAELEEIVDEVETISPPEDVADLQAEFLAGAHDSVDVVGKTIDRVETGEISCGEQLNRAIYGLASTERAERALYRIESKGYFIFGE
jgi:hypothetical protein